MVFPKWLLIGNKKISTRSNQLENSHLETRMPESEPVVRLPHLKAAQPITSSRAVLEWRVSHKPEAATDPQDEGPEAKPHFSRVEKLLARFQAKKGAAEPLNADSPSTEHKIEDDPNVIAKRSSGSMKNMDVSVATCYLSKPPRMVKWRGLGLVPAEESVVIELLRAKNMLKEKMSNPSLQTRPIGTVELLLIEAKGLPRKEHNQSILVFADIRMYPTDQTTRCNWEAKTKIQENEKLLTRTHKVKWSASYIIPVISDSSVLEIEICQLHEEGVGHDSHGLLRLPVKNIMNQRLDDATFFLHSRDRGAKSISICVSVVFQEARGAQGQYFDVIPGEMPKENPLWISSWDAASVLAFKRERTLAMQRVDAALKEDTIQAFELVFEDIRSLDLEDEPACRDALLRLEELKLVRQRQEKAKTQLHAAVQDKSLSPFWLIKSLKAALQEAYASGLTSDCGEVEAALRLLDQVEEQTNNVADDM